MPGDFDRASDDVAGRWESGSRIAGYRGAARVIDTHRISATKFGLTITFSFRIGSHAYSWNWNACAQDTEAENGMGLPGHHGCGSSRLLASDAYTG